MSHEPQLRPLSDSWTPPRTFRPSRRERFAEEELVITRYDRTGKHVIETRVMRPTAKGWAVA